MDIRNSSLFMGIGRYNNFNREINGMQILGVTITTHVTFVWHYFEKLNLYIAFMLFCIFRIGKRFIFFMCSKKKAKIKLVTIICMTSSIFWKKKKENLIQSRENIVISEYSLGPNPFNHAVKNQDFQWKLPVWQRSCPCPKKVGKK